MHEGQFTEKIVEVILSELKKYMEMFLDPALEIDLVNIRTCWEVIPRPQSDLPSLYREINVLKNIATILALASTGDPQAQLLARNFLEVYKERQAILIRPTFFGYLLNFEYLPSMVVALGREINKRVNEMINLFAAVIFSEEDRDRALHGHLHSFVEKWLKTSWNDVTESRAWMMSLIMNHKHEHE